MRPIMVIDCCGFPPARRRQCSTRPPTIPIAAEYGIMHCESSGHLSLSRSCGWYIR